MAAHKAEKSLLAFQEPRYRIIFTGIIAASCLFGCCIARLHVEQLTGNSLLLFANSNGLYADWFLSCKETFYFMLAVGICLYAAGERIFPDTVCRVNPLYQRSALLPGICIGVWLLLSGISCLCSANREVVLRGSCTEYEGLAAIFSYCVLFLFGYNFLGSERSLPVLQRMLLLFGAFTAVLAIFEYTCKPICELPFLQHLMAPPRYREAAESLKSANSFREAVLMFHNSSYAGMFFAMILPFPISRMLSEKNRKVRFMMAVLCALLITAVITTNATAAFYVMTAELLFLIVFLFVRKILNYRMLLCTAGILLILLTATDLITNHAFFGTMRKSMSNAGTYSVGEIYRLHELEITDRNLHLAGEGTGYLLKPSYAEDSVLQVQPDDGTVCEILEASTGHLLISDTASGSKIQADLREGVLYVDAGYQSTLDFAVTADGLYLITQNAQLLREIPCSPMADSPLSAYNSLFTGRGYIWLNTLPILKECFILGKGAGNFPFCFVQNDVVGLCNTNGSYHFVIDKTHSLYLQTAVTAGIPAMLLLTVLFGSFLFSGMRCLCQADQETLRNSSSMQMLLCLYVSTAGYMVNGLVNNSCIAVSPVFWMLFGTAYSLSVRKK